MVKRLSKEPAVGMTCFEDRITRVAHGTGIPFLGASPGFEALRLEWEDAFRGASYAPDGIHLSIRVDARTRWPSLSSPTEIPRLGARLPTETLEKIVL